MKRFLISFLTFLSGLFFLNTLVSAAPDGGWHTDGKIIIDPHGNKVVLKAINWFGFETETHVVHGLWARNLEEMLREIKNIGFNALRIPISNEILKPDVKPNSINFQLNPGLASKNALEALDYFIQR